MSIIDKTQKEPATNPQQDLDLTNDWEHDPFFTAEGDDFLKDVLDETPPQKDFFNDAHRRAIEFVDVHKCSVIAIYPSTKGQAFTGVEWQTRFPTRKELDGHFYQPFYDIAIMCGAVSGDLIGIDIDEKNKPGTFEKIKQHPLFAEITWDECTKANGMVSGYHGWCQVAGSYKPEGGPNIAFAPVGGAYKTLIEIKYDRLHLRSPGPNLRGENKHILGPDFKKGRLFSRDEFQGFVNFLRTFNEQPKREYNPVDESVGFLTTREGVDIYDARLPPMEDRLKRATAYVTSFEAVGGETDRGAYKLAITLYFGFLLSDKDCLELLEGWLPYKNKKEAKGKIKSVAKAIYKGRAIGDMAISDETRLLEFHCRLQRAKGKKDNEDNNTEQKKETIVDNTTKIKPEPECSVRVTYKNRTPVAPKIEEPVLPEIREIDYEDEEEPEPLNGQDELARFKADPTYAYLWRDNIGEYLSDRERLNVACSIEKILEVCPTRGIIPDFIKTFLPSSDCPPLFWLASCLTLCSHLMGRQVAYTEGGSETFANLYILLIAESGLMRKSTAMNAMLGLLQELKTGDPFPGSADFQNTILKSNFTMASLYEKVGFRYDTADLNNAQLKEARERYVKSGMSTEQISKREQSENLTNYLRGINQKELTDRVFDGCILSIWDEYSSFGSMMSKPVNVGMKELFVTGYLVRSSEEYETKGAGKYCIPRPCITLSAATTIPWLISSLQTADIDSGFIPRFLPFYVPIKDAMYTIPDEPDGHYKNEVKAGIMRLLGCKRQRIKASKENNNFLNAWRREFVKTDNPQFESWLVRLETMMVKIAMIYQVSQGIESDCFDMDCMERAGALLNMIKESAGRLLSERITANPEAGKRGDILATIRKCGKKGILRTLLMNNSHASKKELDNYIETLEESGCITVKKQESGRGVRYTAI